MKSLTLLLCISLSLLVTEMIFPSSVLAETCDEIKKKECQTIACLQKKNRCGLSGFGASGPGGGTLFNKKNIELYDSEQNQ